VFNKNSTIAASKRYPDDSLFLFFDGNWRRSKLELLPKTKQFGPIGFPFQLQSKTDHFPGGFWQVSGVRTVEASFDLWSRRWESNFMPNF